MENMQLISIWKAPRKKNLYITPHVHKYYELVYYLEGNGLSNIGDTAHAFHGATFAVIAPGIQHDECHLEESTVICLEFSGAPQLPTGLHDDPLGVIQKILKDLLRETKYQDFGYRDMIRAKLQELCLQVLRIEKVSPEEKNFEYIINYLTENFHEKIVLSHCAAQLNLSYDYFQHKFKALTGLSPQQFLMNRRLTAASELLPQRELSCTEIAYRCGFSTSAQFSSLFKREYGVTPMQFRRLPM